MELVYQLMMGVSLAACAGFRAYLPLFIMGIMARTSHLQLNPSMQFLTSDGMLIVFGAASILEFCGDKIIAVDHFLDAIGSVARPVAGTLLVSSMITKTDPQTSLLLGMIAGGGTALTMHGGKAVVRAKATMLAPLHGGTGNAALSITEDFMAAFGILLSFLYPVIAFFGAMILMIIAAGMIYLAYQTGRKFFGLLFGGRDSNDRRLVDTPDLTTAL